MLSEDFKKHCNELLWSLWTELGVPGVVQRHANCAIDPEALTVFTDVSRPDPRLRDLVDVWQAQNERYIATSRLRSFHKTFSTGGVALDALQNGRGAETRRSERVTKRAVVDLGRPGTIVLRCRALLGNASRADILAFLGFDPRRAVTASQLATRVSLTKLNVAKVLNDFCRAGICVAQKEKNVDVYRLVRAREVRAFAAPWPTSFPLWNDIFAILIALGRLISAATDQPPRVAGVEASKLLNEWGPKLQHMGLSVPQNRGADLAGYGGEVLQWTCDLALQLADGTSPLLRAR